MPADVPEELVEFTDEELLRYSRQIMLPQIGIEGQSRLARSSALIIGMGGLGAPVAMYLAGSGVGRLTIVDDDVVDLSNLQRQIIHTTAAIGEPKVLSAKRTLEALNPHVEVVAIGHRLEGEALARAVAECDVAIEATDRFEARFALNRTCFQVGRPLVSGAVIRMEGQVAVFRGDRPGSPCYECLYGATGGGGGTCAENGVLGSVAGIVGAIQATEAVKVLLDIGERLEGRLLVIDALTMEFRTIRLRRDPRCPTCSDDRPARRPETGGTGHRSPSPAAEAGVS